MKNLEVPPREKLWYVAVKKTFNCRQETKQSNSCRHCCGARSRTLSARLCICILLFPRVSDYIFSLFQGSPAYSLYGFLCKSKDLSSVLPCTFAFRFHRYSQNSRATSVRVAHLEPHVQPYTTPREEVIISDLA